MTAVDTPTIFPVTVGGWVALVASISACVGLFFTWGRLLQKFDDLLKRVEILESNRKDIDLLEGDLTVVRHTLWGPTGDNGFNATIRRLRIEVDAINNRNRVIDAITERERGALASGHEDRIQTRRREDKLLRGEDPDA